ncbi:MAG: hypothetical protein U0236_21050 [Nitrospira sp.]
MARNPRTRAPIAPNVNARAATSDNETIFEIARQRIPATADPLAFGEGKIGADLTQLRIANTAVLFAGMQEVGVSLSIVGKVLAVRPAPAQLIATLVQPDGSAGRQLQVQFDPTSLGKQGPPETVLTDDSGAFHLPLPAGAAFENGGSLSITVHGGAVTLPVQIPFSQIAGNGLAGQVALPQFMLPLPVSILASLLAVAPPPRADQPPPLPDNPVQLPIVRIGDDEDCLLKFGLNQSIDRFPYGVFFRLVEPRASIGHQVLRWRFPGADGFTFLPKYTTGATGAGDDPNVVTTYVDRVPVDQPLSVDGFRDRLIGLEANGTISSDETVPMAGTLGLGYVLTMSQRWTFKGLALGDLVYSLPLAPGEQQQVAIFERRDTNAVFESESFSEEQALIQQASADTSTTATFGSAFNEVINGRSSFQVDSSTSSVGGSLFGLISGGSGSSSSSGTSSQSLEGQRNITQNAAQATHSAAQNSSYARRSANRTGMRLASASESQSLTTKTITNHNHTRALTMQYWEVLRMYDVTTAIDGLTLTVLIPLQVVRFLPPGQPLTLDSAALVDTRFEVLQRYRSLIKHADVVERHLPRKFQHGLKLLRQFASDPTATVEPFGGAAEDVIRLSLWGSFLPCEDIFVNAVTNRGTRIGPVRLAQQPTGQIPPDRFASQTELEQWLIGQRQTASIQATGAFAIPKSMNRNSIIGFEISRRFRQLSYTLISPAQAQINALNGLFGITSAQVGAVLGELVAGGAANLRQTVSLDAGHLERLLGGPMLGSFNARIVELAPDGSEITGENYANASLAGVELPQDPYPVPALQLAPTLRYQEILEIEQMAQHVVMNTMRYSQAVWASMSAGERAILLEGYTIGVPTGGVPDASQMVPLLNCIENRVIGFFGNSMIMPFIIPKALAMASSGPDGQQVDPATISNSLLAYHQAAFTPPRSTLALPTRGVLGEAVLGHCSSAEKIDLTRFWNWQDSPSDTAPTISPVTLPTGSPSLVAGVTAPNSLTQLPSLINNVLTAPAPDTALLQRLSQDAAAQKDFDSSLTGATQLSGLINNAQNVSNAARADALKVSKELQSQVIATVGNIVGGMYGGNPEAGSKAAAAANGRDTGTAAGGNSQPGTAGGRPAGGGSPGGSTGSSGSGTTGGNTGGSTGSGSTSGGSTGGSSTGGGGSPSPAPTPAPSGGPVPA